MNRIIDSNVFGSGNLDKPFRIEDEKNNAEIKKWLESRKLSFFQDEDKGILYLQFASARCPVMDGSLESQFGLDSVFEDQELGDLQGLLFMFSVSFFNMGFATIALLIVDSALIFCCRYSFVFICIYVMQCTF